MKECANKHGDISGQNGTDFKLYKYRWFVLFLFCSYAGIISIQYMQYAVITNIIAKYYGIRTFTVSWTTLVYMVCYIVLCFPASYLTEKYDLRKITIFGSALTACGLGIRLYSVAPDRYYLALIGQTLVAVANVFLLSLPSKVAATWFGSHEISTACSVIMFGIHLGAALGSVISPNVVKNHDDIDLIGEELFSMIMYNAIVAYVICFLIVLFFEAKPRTPPNNSQLLAETAPDIEYLKSIKNLALNKDYLLILVAIGISTALYNTYGVHLNTIYLHYFPGLEVDVGLIGLIGLLAGGCLGSVVLGYILDKTHKFKLISFCLLLIISSMYLLSAVLLDLELRIPAFIALCVFEFFASALLVVGFEYAVEVTYPEPEATVLATLNAIRSAFGIILSVIVESLFTAIGHFYANIAIACLFGVCSLAVIGISSNLRRLKTNQMARNENSNKSVS